MIYLLLEIVILNKFIASLGTELDYLIKNYLTCKN